MCRVSLLGIYQRTILPETLTHGIFAEIVSVASGIICTAYLAMANFFYCGKTA